MIDKSNNKIFGVRIKSLFVSTGVLPVLIVISLIVFTLVNARFATVINAQNLATQSVFLVLIGLGQMMVLITGGFDLSVGSNVALTSVTSALVMQWISNGGSAHAGLAITGGLAAALLVGAVCGALNGWGVSILRVNPFIVTLATASVFQGATLLVSQGQEISGIPMSLVLHLGSGLVGPVPTLVVAAIPAVLIVILLIAVSPFGRALYAIGGNVKAANVAGLPINAYLFMTYVACGVLTGYASWLLTARVSTGQPLLGGEFALESITAAILGGASLRGGEGGVWGALGGAFFITLLANGMDLMRLGSNYQLIAIGVVLMTAVVVDRKRIEWRKELI